MKLTAWLLLSSIISTTALESTDECCIISGNNGNWSCDCSNCGLTAIPKNIPVNVQTLFFRNNTLKTISSSIFKEFTSLIYLDLSINNIEYFSNEAFIGLSKLKHLDLYQGNYVAFGEALFAPLVELQYLRISMVYQNGQPFPTNWIDSLSPGLNYLELPLPQGFVFSNHFLRLKNLEHLIISGSNCRLKTVTNETFMVFSKASLKTLEIKGCFLQDILPDALSMLRDLKTLNFACNYHNKLNFREMFIAAKNLPTASLDTLVIDGSGRQNLNSLSSDLFDSASFSNLRRLSIRSTRIIKVDTSLLYHIPRLEHINIGFNTILKVVPDDPDEAINMTAILLNNMNVTTVDTSYFGMISGDSYLFRNMFCWPDPLYTDDFFKTPPYYISNPHNLRMGRREIDYSNFEDHEKFLESNVPYSFRNVYVKHIGIKRDDFYGFSFEPNNIVYFDFSENQIKNIAGPLKGFDNLQGLDINSCGIEEITDDFLNTLSSLVFLNLSMNSLPTHKFGFKEPKINDTMLRVLDISYNSLKSVESTHYKHITTLEVLNLTNNPIAKIDTDFSTNVNLKYLDLSDCSLTYLPKSVREGFDALNSKSNGTFQVLLGGNPWQCMCEFLDYIEWVRSTRVNIIDRNSLTCSKDNKTVAILELDLTDFRSSCWKVPLAQVVVIPCILIFACMLATSLSYHYRWTLKWKFYLMRRYFRMRRKPNDEHLLSNNHFSDREYDAFVSYNHEADYEWIQTSLLEKVEDDWKLKLCVGQRDFVVGYPIAENICNAIDSSKFTIIVITPAFVSSSWCEFELHMALTRGREHLIMIYKDEIDISQTSKTLRTLMKSVNYIEYSKNADGQAMFWQRLHDALTPQTDNFIM